MKKYRPKKQPGRALETKKMKRLVDNDSGIYWKIFDIKLFSRDKYGVLKVLEEKLALGTKKYWVATVNPEFIMATTKDSHFKAILGRTDLNVVDGVGVIWARELDRRSSMVGGRKMILGKLVIGIKVGIGVLMGKYRNQLASGADLIEDLVKLAKKMDKKIFFLGGWGDRAEKSARFFVKKKLDGRSLMVDGRKKLNVDWCQGEPEVSNNEVVEKINKFKPDILLVAYGMKKQEFWIDKNLKNLEVGLVMGVGRSFDYYSGDLKRAPQWARKMGMEWLYSLFKEPKRFKRQLVLPGFVWQVLKK